MRIREPLVNIDLIMSLPLHPVYEQNIKPLLHGIVKKNYDDAFLGTWGMTS